MGYAGNSALSTEIQQRVLSTFDHTLELVERDRREEALLGCDFILRLDPHFEPARSLQRRLRGDDLDAPAVDLGSVAGELRAAARRLHPDSAAARVEAGPPSAGQSPARQRSDLTHDELRERLIDLLDRRDFASVLALGAKNAELIATDPVLQRTMESAEQRLEAAPYTAGFLVATRQALAAGDTETAERHLLKARELDPSHPDIRELEDLLAATSIKPPPGDDLRSLLDLDGDRAQVAATGGGPGFDLERLLGGAGEPPVLDGGDQRISELLDEGQTAFDRRDYQAAIDAWSRIYLIDIDHQGANERIELARKLKAEYERRVEEVLHDGLTRFEAGNPQEARRYFERVLELEPGHLAAREYLQQIEAGVTAAPPRSHLVMPVLQEVPPAPRGGAAPGERPQPAPPADWVPPPAPRPSARRRFLLIGGLVLVAATAGGWYTYTHWQSIFPNSSPESTAPAPAAADPVTRAVKLHEAGKTPLAIAQLRRLAPDNPRYSEAQALIAQWESAEQSAEAPAPEAGAAVGERQAALIGEARGKVAHRELLAARELLQQAAALGPLDAPAQELVEQLEEDLAPIAHQIELFRQGDWEYALPDLWRARERDPANRDVRRLIVDSYYNLGVRDLQRGHPEAAIKKFEEALALAPEDQALARLRVFAQTYEERPEDLLYRTFVKYLPFR